MLGSFTREGKDVDGTLYLHYGITPIAGSNYDFVYWLKDDGTTPTTVNIDNVLTNETTFDNGDTFIGFFAPHGAYIVRLLYPDDTAAGSIWYEGQRAPRTINGISYYFSTDSTVENPTYITANPNAGYQFVGWYDMPVDGGAGTLVSTDEKFDVRNVDRDMVLKPAFKLREALTITYQSTFDNPSNVSGRTYVSSTDGTTTNVTSFSEKVMEGGEAIGATASTSGSIRAFQGWIDENSNYVERKPTFIPKGFQLRNGAVYRAVFLPTGQDYVIVDSNDYSLGNVSYVQENDELLYADINSADQIIIDSISSTQTLRMAVSAVANSGAVFDHWELDNNSLPTNIYGSTLSKSLNLSSYMAQGWEIHTLKAVFTKKPIITYDLSQIHQVGNNSPDYQHWVDVPWCSNVRIQGEGVTSEETDIYLHEVDSLSNYTVIPPTSSTRVTQTNNGYNLLTHTFTGYRRSDNNELITAEQIANGYTLNVSSPITLTAEWDAYFPNKAKNVRYNTNTCGFFVRLFDNVFDIGDTNTYTDCLFTTRLFPSGNFESSGNGARYDFFGNGKASDATIIQNIDRDLRANALSGITYNHSKLQSEYGNQQGEYAPFVGSTLRLEAFPNDEFFFGRIRRWNASAPSNRKIEINGTKIPQEMLTSDYFDLRWYVLKDQENSWHIDGMLIPKYANLRLEKTFTGPATALDSAKDGYVITVTETVPREGRDADTHSLTLHYNPSSNPNYSWTFGNTKDETESTVQVSEEGNHLIWVLNDLIPLTGYTVTESEYDSDNAEYVTVKSYEIYNTPQTTGLSGGSDTASIDSVYCYSSNVSTDTYQTVSFSNLYTKKFVMTILKRDGTTLRGLSNVTFKFTRVNNSTNESVTEYATTDDSGHITINFPQEAGTYSFELVEQEHEGYERITTITGTAIVSAEGTVVIDDVTGGVTGDNVMVSIDENNKSVAYVVNTPERKKVVVNKVWTEGTTPTPVTMQLLRNGVAIKDMYVVLGASESTAEGVIPSKTTGWSFEWDDLPAYVDGREVIYTVREEWIGEPGGENSIHYNPRNDSDGFLEFIVNQSQTETTETVDDMKVTTVSVRIENTEDNGQIMFSKVDTGEKVVAGAVFTLYQDSGVQNGGPKLENGNLVPFNPSKTYSSNANGVVVIDDLNSGYYWLKETSAPAGYQVNKGVYLLQIRANNSEIDLCDPTNGYMPIKQIDTIVDEPVTANIKIVKVDANNNSTKLTGAVFSLHRTILGVTWPAPMRGYDQLTTDANGEFSISGLSIGTYTLIEKTAPSGYRSLDANIQITVASDGTVTATDGTRSYSVESNTVGETLIQSINVPNEKEGKVVKLRKLDRSDRTKKLEGIKFQIYDGDPDDGGNLINFTENAQWWNTIQDNIDASWAPLNGGDTLISASTGRFYYGYLPTGTYYVVETETISNYIKPSKPFKLEISYEGVKTSEYPYDSWTTFNLDSSQTFYNVDFLNDEIPKTSITVVKEWSGDHGYHTVDSVDVKLIRYKHVVSENDDDEDVNEEEGTLNISHIASGLINSNLPEGFTATYSYSAAGQTPVTGVAAGSYTVPAGTYTVTATVTASAAPSGYTYSSTSGSITVTVPADGNANAEFISTYTQQQSSNTNLTTVVVDHLYDNNGVITKIGDSVTGYTNNGKISVTISRPDNSGLILYSRIDNGSENELAFTDHNTWANSGWKETYIFDVPDEDNCTISIIQKSWSTDVVSIYSVTQPETSNKEQKVYLNPRFFFASATGVPSGSPVGLPSGYIEDTAFNGTVTLSESNSWSNLFSDLPTKDNDGYDYYYELQEVASLTDYSVSYDPEGPVIAQAGTMTFTAINTSTLPDTGDLKVSKTVTGNAGSNTQEFSFTVTLNNHTGEENFNTVKVSNGTSTEDTLTFHDETATFVLKHNESLTIKDIPAYSTYSVEEIPVDGYTTTTTGNPTGIIPAGGMASVSFYNDKTVGNGGLKLKKLVEAPENEAAAEQQKVFTFTIEILNEDNSVNEAFAGSYGDLTFTEGKAIKDLKHNESVTIRGLPYGTLYKISETYTDPYEQTTLYAESVRVNNGEVRNMPLIDRITSDSIIDVVVTNTKTETINIVAQKGFTYGSVEPTAVQFTLKRKGGDEDGFHDIDVVTVTAADEWKHEWTNLDKTYENWTGGVDFTYFVVETGLYFGELVDPIPADKWVAANISRASDGNLAYDATDDAYKITITNTSYTDVPVVKEWPDFSDAKYNWYARFRLLKKEVLVAGNDSTDDAALNWTVVNDSNNQPLTVTATKAENAPSFSHLDVYCKHSNGNVYQVLYKVEEYEYKVWENSDENNPIAQWSEDNSLSTVTYNNNDYIPVFTNEIAGENVVSTSLDERYTIVVNNMPQQNYNGKLVVKKEWLGILKEDLADFPEVYFTLYYLDPANYEINAEQAHVYDSTYVNYPLNYGNNWTVAIGNLPSQYRYFVVETANEHQDGESRRYDNGIYVGRHIKVDAAHTFNTELYYYNIDGYQAKDSHSGAWKESDPYNHIDVFKYDEPHKYAVTNEERKSTERGT